LSGHTALFLKYWEIIADNLSKVLPLVQPLIDYLSSLPGSDQPNAHIFSRAAAHKRTNSLSNQFREIMADAGLVEPRTHEARGKGRSQAREASELSFHSLRHSAVTMLKAAGVSDFIAREIVGHESAAVSRQYKSPPSYFRSSICPISVEAA
jgi:integrase